MDIPVFQELLNSMLTTQQLRRDLGSVITPFRATFLGLLEMLLHELPTRPVLRVFETIGQRAGKNVARLVREHGPNCDLARTFELCLEYSDASGFTRFELEHFEGLETDSEISASVLLHASVETEAYLARSNPQKMRVCAMQTGYLTGVATELHHRPILFKEAACKGEGAHTCRLVSERSAEQINSASPIPYWEGAEFPNSGTLMPLMGQSNIIQTLRSRISVVANTQATVLIQGETGTGKELIARSLHMMSTRDQMPLVVMNCAALPETLVDAELFGVEKGAFTGAHQSRQGKFQNAHGGTLFLDEIGLLPHSVQGKLLRVLEDGCFDIVGGRTVEVDVRLIAATNVDLSEAAARGDFREDLYYRLCTVVLRAPPLRERKEDIAELAQKFLYEAARRHGKKGPHELTPDAIEYLMALEYPGNVRELKQIIEAATIFAPPDMVIDRQFLETGRQEKTRSRSTENKDTPSLEEVASAALASGIPLKDIEQACIEEALQRVGGNFSKAAKLLGMSRRQIEYRVTHR